MGNEWEVWVYRTHEQDGIMFTAWQAVYMGEEKDEALQAADTARANGARMVKLEWRPI